MVYENSKGQRKSVMRNSTNLLSKKNDGEDDMIYLMKRIKSNIILERGEDIEMIIWWIEV